MPIFRVEKTQNYTVMSNHHLQDGRLSWKAKGLLSYILSLPENWDYSAAGLAAASREGVTAVRTALTELENCGYLLRQPLRGTDGKITDWQYTVYEQPREADPSAPEDDEPPEGAPDAAKPDAGSPLVGFPQVDEPKAGKPEAEKPEAENLTQQNTNIINTNKQNTNTTKDAGAAADLMARLADAEETVKKCSAVVEAERESRPILSCLAQKRFDRWWGVWPKKTAKRAAEKAWKSLRPDDDLTDRMIAAVEMQKKLDSRFRDERYIPHPATWINGGEWENSYTPDTPNAASFDAGEFFDLALQHSMEGLKDGSKV